MLDLNKLPFVYWDNKTIISYLQRQIIVHSILYYEKSISVISDKYFDELCHTLIKLQKAHIKDFEQSEYFYCMNDFDGSTGHDIVFKLNKKDKEILYQVVSIVYKNFKKSGGNILK